MSTNFLRRGPVRENASRCFFVCQGERVRCRIGLCEDFSGPCCLVHGGKLPYMCVRIGVERKSVAYKSVANNANGVANGNGFCVWSI